MARLDKIEPAIASDGNNVPTGDFSLDRRGPALAPILSAWQRSTESAQYTSA